MLSEVHLRPVQDLLVTETLVGEQRSSLVREEMDRLHVLDTGLGLRLSFVSRVVGLEISHIAVHSRVVPNSTQIIHRFDERAQPVGAIRIGTVGGITQ